MELGYDIERVRRLDRATQQTIAALASLRSDDPEADDAVGAVRATGRLLADEWMPLIRRILISDALIAALRTGTTAAVGWRPHAGCSDDELLDLLTDLDHRALANGATGVDRALANEFAARFADRPDFAGDVARHAHRWPVLADLLPLAGFSDDVVVSTTRALITAGFTGPADGHDAMVARLTAFVAEHRPALATAVLDDDDVVGSITSGYFAPAVERSLGELMSAAFATDGGFGLLRRLVAVGDRTINEFALHAVATAMPIHFPLLPHRRLADGSSSVVPVGSTIDLGSYDGVAALYGQVIALPDAQRAAGATIDSMLDVQFGELLPQVLAANELEPSPRDVGGLIGAVALDASALVELLFADGIASEEQRRNMLDGAAAARRARLTSLFRLGTSGVLRTAVPGATARTLLERAIALAVERPARVSPAVPDAGYRFTVPDRVAAATLVALVAHPGVRQRAGLVGLAPGTWRTVRSIVNDLRGAATPGERRRALERLDELSAADRARIDDLVREAQERSGSLPHAE